MLKYFIMKFEIIPTKYKEAMSNSQNPPKIKCFTHQKRSHSAFSAYNVQEGIRYNYIPNMKALVPVLIEKKKEKKETLTLS